METKRLFRNLLPSRVPSHEILRGSDVKAAEVLFDEGRIESLVREGRTPRRVVPTNKNQSQFNTSRFQVPPEGYTPADIKFIRQASDGVLTYVDINDNESVGDLYRLSMHQTRMLEQRVSDELSRINLNQGISPRLS